MTPTTVTDAAAILRALECVRAGCPCHAAARRGHGKTHCPAHPDLNPSLNVSQRDGRVLLKCFAGCEQDAVIAALRERGLWPERPEPNGHRPERVTRYVVRDRDGRPVAVHVRRDLPAGGKMFAWNRPDGTSGLGGMRAVALPLYGIDRLGEARRVVVTEGEKAAEALLALGVPAVGTVTGAAATPGDTALRPLLGREVILWPDADDRGRKHMARIAARLVALGARDVRLIDWPDAPEHGDAADFVAAGHDADAVRRLAHAAQPWEPERAPQYHATLSVIDIVELNPVDLGALPEPGPMVFVVEGLVPEGFVTNLYGDGGQGKSLLALHLALAVARGAPFLGRVTSCRRVLYLDWELDADEQRRRWGRVCRGAGLDEVMPGLWYVPARRPLREMAPAVVEWVARGDPALVIVDSVGKAMGSDPMATSEIIGFYAALDQLGTVLAIDHQGRGGESYEGRWEFGPSYKRHLARSSIQVERVGQTDGQIGLVLRHKKSNFGPLSLDLHATLGFAPDRVTLEVAEADVVRHGDTFGVRGAILEQVTVGPMTAHELAEALPEWSEGTVANAVYALKRAGLLVVTGRDGRTPRYGLAISSPQYPQGCGGVGIVESGASRSSRCRQCGAVLSILNEAGLCGRCVTGGAA